MPDQQERRQNPRYPLSAEVKVQSSEYEAMQMEHPLEAVDISTGGMLVAGRFAGCDLGVTLSLRLGIDGENEMTVDATIVRTTETGFAVQFVELDSETSEKLTALVDGLTG